MFNLLLVTSPGNSAANGGAFAISGNLVIVDCIVNNNKAEGDGGGGYLEENSNTNMSTTVFRANLAVHAGGVLWIRKGIVNIRNTSIACNRAGNRGGVIDAQQESVINISKMECWGNVVEGGYGGVLAVQMGTIVSISDAKIHNNSARACGAMLINTKSVLEMHHSGISGNFAEVLGGALGIQNHSLLVVVNSSFTENSAYHAGSIVIRNATGYLENCTLKGNQGMLSGAINIDFSHLKLANTLFLKNKGHEEEDIHAEISEASLINKLHTYRCKFIHGNITVSSNEINFKQIADQKDLIGPFTLNNQAVLEMKETQFASSKNFCI